jgi:hypothetical protein
VVQDRSTKVIPFLFSGTTIKLIIKFTCIMGISFTNLSLFFQETSFAINTLLSHPCERRCSPLTQNSTLKSWRSSHMPCFSLSPAKRHPQTASFRRPKQWKWSVLNQESQEAMGTWFIFLFGRTLQMHFNFFKVCTYCSELIMAPLFKNSTNKIPSLSHKTLAITWHTAVCIFHFFLPCSPYSHNLAHPNFVFSSLKDALQGCHFVVDKMKCSLHDKHFCHEFCATSPVLKTKVEKSRW